MILTVSNIGYGKSFSLKSGETAPFAGVLIDNDTANRLNNDTIQLEHSIKVNGFLSQINDLQKQNLDLDAQKLTELSVQNDKLAKALNDSKEMNTIEKVLYVGLGVAAVSLGALVASRLK